MTKPPPPLFVVPALLALSACAATPKPVAAPLVAIHSAPMPRTGLERVLGQTARGLTSMFGDPDQDVREAQGARRLQFAGPFCILDAYLYPKGKTDEAQVTYLDARQPDGRDIDRASCIAATIRRKEAR